MQDRLTHIFIALILALSLFTTLAFLISAIPALIISLPVTAYLFNKLTPWSQLKFSKDTLIVWIILVAIFSFITPKLLIHTDSGLSTGIINAYGDIGWHMSNVTYFATQPLLSLENPIFSETRLVYPFMSNFFSALLLKAGASFSQTLVFPAWLLIPILLTLLYSFTKQISDSKFVATFTTLLFICGGGVLGWLRAFDENFNHTLADFTGVGTDPSGFHFLNPITALILPQRALLFGLPIAFSILLLLTFKNKNKYHFIIAGVLSGLLPLFHAHSVLALIPVIIIIFARDMSSRSREPSRGIRDLVTTWLFFIIPALVVGLPEVFYFLTGTGSSESFFRFEPGWMAPQSDKKWVVYWIQNTGLLIPVTIWGLFIKTPKLLKQLAIAGLIIFVIANLWLFAPWAWDNIKLLLYFYIFTLPLALYATWLGFSKNNFAIKVVILIFLLLHGVSGFLDVMKVSLPGSTTWGEWSSADISFAEQIKQNTSPDAIIITAPAHNSPVVLTGRRRYLGYDAHVWSHGLDPGPRRRAVDAAYINQSLQFPESQPTHILVGPQERFQYKNLQINPAWQPVITSADYTLYKLLH